MFSYLLFLSIFKPWMLLQTHQKQCYNKGTSSYFIKQKCYWCTSFQLFFVSGFTHPNEKTYFHLPIFSRKYVQISAPVKYFFKIIFELWRSIAQAVYKAFFCHSMTELSVSFFVKFGLRKLSQFTLTYFLPTALDIQKLIRQFTVLEKGATQKHHNDFTETPLFIFFPEFERFSRSVLKLFVALETSVTLNLLYCLFFHISWY